MFTHAITTIMEHFTQVPDKEVIWFNLYNWFWCKSVKESPAGFVSMNGSNQSCVFFVSSSPNQHVCQILLPEAPKSGRYWRQKGEFWSNTFFSWRHLSTFKTQTKGKIHFGAFANIYMAKNCLFCKSVRSSKRADFFVCFAHVREFLWNVYVKSDTMDNFIEIRRR